MEINSLCICLTENAFIVPSIVFWTFFFFFLIRNHWTLLLWFPEYVLSLLAAYKFFYLWFSVNWLWCGKMWFPLCLCCLGFVELLGTVGWYRPSILETQLCLQIFFFCLNLSLPLFPRSTIMDVLGHLLLFHKSQTLYSLFKKIFFLFVLQLGYWLSSTSLIFCSALFNLDKPN